MGARLGERAAGAGYALGWACLRWVPERVARQLFRLIADVVWRRRGRAVRQLETNLGRVVGRDADEQRMRRLTRAAVRSYFRYWLEVFRLPAMGRERILSGMRIKGVDTLFANIDAGRGVVATLPHMGNWDHAGTWMVLSGLPLTTVAERLRPEALFDRFVAFRERLGMEVIALSGGEGDAFGSLARRLRAGGFVCLVADRDLTTSGVEVEFFGEPARMPAGPALLALQTGAALMPVTLWYEGEHWCVQVHDEIPPPAGGRRRERVAAMTQEVARVFETAIADHPEDWHMLQRLWIADLDGGRAVPEGAP